MGQLGGILSSSVGISAPLSGRNAEPGDTSIAVCLVPTQLKLFSLAPESLSRRCLWASQGCGRSC